VESHIKGYMEFNPHMKHLKDTKRNSTGVYWFQNGGVLVSERWRTGFRTVAYWFQNGGVLVVLSCEETSIRVKIAMGYLRGLAKIGFPGKEDFDALVKKYVARKELEMENEAKRLEEEKAAAAAKAAASRRSWGF
jgi:hypothetical protein